MWSTCDHASHQGDADLPAARTYTLSTGMYACWPAGWPVDNGLASCRAW